MANGAKPGRRSALVSGGVYGRGVSEQSADAWNEAAAAFDLPADHGLHSVEVRAAWTELLIRVLPASRSRIADLGCGTGSLTLLAAELGHEVDGIDFSEQMLILARAKVAGRPRVTFSKGDAASPPLQPRHNDVVMCRHLLWALPDPAASLNTWTDLLRPGGRLVLIEGKWSTGAGLAAEETEVLLRASGHVAAIEHLTDPRYWGGPVTDDRYVAMALRSPRRASPGAQHRPCGRPAHPSVAERPTSPV